MPTKVYTTIAP